MRTKKNASRKENLVEESEIKKAQESSHDGELTLQQVGDIFSVTRMRICQIEKNSLKKLASLKDLKSLI